jgi:hypothetical protein
MEGFKFNHGEFSGSTIGYNLFNNFKYSLNVSKTTYCGLVVFLVLSSLFILEYTLKKLIKKKF